jgi:hypothetical protein
MIVMDPQNCAVWKFLDMIVMDPQNCAVCQQIHKGTACEIINGVLHLQIVSVVRLRDMRGKSAMM